MLRVRLVLAVLGLAAFFGFSLSLVMMGKFPEETVWGIGWILFLLILVVVYLLWAFESRLSDVEDDLEDNVWEELEALKQRLATLEAELDFHLGAAEEEEADTDTSDEDEEPLLTAKNLVGLALQDATEPDIAALHVQEQSVQPTEQLGTISSD